jgi:integrase
VNLTVEDYFQTGKRSLIRFREKGGKEKEIPVRHKLEELLDEYLQRTGLKHQPAAPLFPIALGKTRKLGNQPMTRIDAARMLKRRLRDAGIIGDYSPHSFRLLALRTSSKMEAFWKQRNGLPATPIAARQNFTIAVDGRCYSKIWNGFGTRFQVMKIRKV